MISLVPRVSRVIHIGLQDGIHFQRLPENVRNKWLEIQMPSNPIDYTNVTPRFRDWNTTTGEFLEKPCEGFWCSEEGEPK